MDEQAGDGSGAEGPGTVASGAARTRLFAPLPRDGFWTSLGLTRAQFFGILLASCAVFLLWGGPLWLRLGGDDFARLASSYALIPVAVAAALSWNGKLRFSLFFAATVVIAILKLVVTAGIDLALGIALGTR